MGVRLERPDAEIRGLAAGPQLERLTKSAGHVAVSVHAPGGLGRVEQPRAGARLLAGREPVTRDLDARPAARLQRLRERHVKATTLGPGHVGVQRLARQRVPEGSPAGGGLRDELAPQELGQPCRAGRARHDGKVELLPGDRGDLGRRPARGREVRYADEHGIADGVGHRHLAAAGELQPAPAGHDGVGEQQRLRELLDEEGDAPGPVVDRPDERRSRGLLQEMREQLRRLGWAQRRDRDLGQAPGSPQLVPDAAQRVIARQAVGAIGGEDHQLQLIHGLGECRQELEGGLVGPLEVVEHEDGGFPTGKVRQGGAHGLEQRRAIGLRSRLTEFRQDQRQLVPQRAALVQALRVHPQQGAQSGHHRSVWRCGALARPPPQHGCPRFAGDVVDEAGLPDSGIACHQHERAASQARLPQRLLEPASLVATPDENAAGSHARSLGPPAAQEDRRRRRVKPRRARGRGER